MSLGRRTERQECLWVSCRDLPESPGNPFYEKLNAIVGNTLGEEGRAYTGYLITVLLYIGYRTIKLPAILPGRNVPYGPG